MVGTENPRDTGYQDADAITVFDRPSSSDSAIVTALSLEYTQPIDPDRVEMIIPFLERLDEELARLPEFTGSPTLESLSEHMEQRAEVFVELTKDPAFEGIRSGDTSPAVRMTLQFIVDVLRYYRPGFDELPRQDQTALIKHQCRLVNEEECRVCRVYAREGERH